MNEKTKHFLSYIAKKYSFITITSIMKLSYLIDLVAVTRKQNQISNFKYIRYKFGPFSQKIYGYISDLVEEEILLERVDHSPRGDEYIVYEFNEESENIKFDKLKEKELEITDEVLENLQGLGPKVLTEIAYKTKPMIKLGAKPDNDIGLNEVLNLSA